MNARLSYGAHTTGEAAGKAGACCNGRNAPGFGHLSVKPEDFLDSHGDNQYVRRRPGKVNLEFGEGCAESEFPKLYRDEPLSSAE
jgi:hypothetical protein